MEASTNEVEVEPEEVSVEEAVAEIEAEALEEAVTEAEDLVVEIEAEDLAEIEAEALEEEAVIVAEASETGVAGSIETEEVPVTQLIVVEDVVASVETDEVLKVEDNIQLLELCSIRSVLFLFDLMQSESTSLFKLKF